MRGNRYPVSFTSGALRPVSGGFNASLRFRLEEAVGAAIKVTPRRHSRSVAADEQLSIGRAIAEIGPALAAVDSVARWTDAGALADALVARRDERWFIR